MGGREGGREGKREGWEGGRKGRRERDGREEGKEGGERVMRGWSWINIHMSNEDMIRMHTSNVHTHMFKVSSLAQGPKIHKIMNMEQKSVSMTTSVYTLYQPIRKVNEGKTSQVICCTGQVTCSTSHVTCCPSQMTCFTSHVTCCPSQVTWSCNTLC